MKNDKNELKNKFQLEKYAKNYSFVNPIPEVSKNELQTGRVGPIINVFLNMTIALRAQVVRHRNFTIKDDLMSIIKKRNWFTTLGHKININIAAEVEFWKTVINKRQCWIAQYGIWKEIIVAAQQFINISEKDVKNALKWTFKQIVTTLVLWRKPVMIRGYVKFVLAKKGIKKIIEDYNKYKTKLK